MTTNLKYMMAFFLTIFGVIRAQAFNNEICTDHSGRVKIVIHKQFKGNLRRLELYKDGKLLKSDSGPFRTIPCHVSGSIQYGQFFSYSGCYPFGQKAAVAISWDKYFRPIQLSMLGKRLELTTLNLNTLNCSSR